MRLGDGKDGPATGCFGVLYSHRVHPRSDNSHSREYLKLPKSTLRTQFAHGAKSDIDSDFKFETEYLLDCSIPDKPPGHAIFLEECLAAYFTNIVQVRRKLATPGDQTPNVNYTTKPNLYPTSSSSASSSAPPPYVGDGNGYYGGDEKASLKANMQIQERNVTAWQVFPLSFANNSFSNYFLIMSLHPGIQRWR
jgi:hypothetical protein